MSGTGSSGPKSLADADTLIGSDPAIESGDPTLASGEGAPPRRKAPQLERGSALGRYVILGKLGAGGMGTVYAAFDPELDRKVALKLLTRSDVRSLEGTAGRVRLQREAQAMARLNHPNVIGVYDVGEVDGQVFIAMEFVAGKTLRDWVKQTKPGNKLDRERVLEVFIAAASGLAAAHEKGVVHRDFKPENVMVGDDGRVRVLDFGLAREGKLAPQTTDPMASGRFAARLTQTGSVMGTPLYMAPEQHNVKPSDERSDQFSLCVALYEALYGERPFDGVTLTEIAAAVTTGKVRAAPTSPRVPQWIRKVVLRGLATEPTDRHGSMRALIEALENDPVRRRRRMLVGAVAAIALIGTTFAATRAAGPTGSVCAGFDDQLESAWGGDSKSAAEDAFAAVGTARADEVWSRVEAILDDYGQRWAATARGNCEATRIRHEQDEELLELRERCLEHALRRLKATGELFARADAPLVNRAANAALSLPRLAACNDARELRRRVAPPDDADVHKQVDDLRAVGDDIRLFTITGRMDDAAKLTEALEADARATHYKPVIAESLEALGWYKANLAEFDEGLDFFDEAVLVAEEIGYDQTTVSSLAGVMRVIATRDQDIERVERIARRGLAIAAREGSPEMRAGILAQLGAARITAQQPDAALTVLLEAVQLHKSMDDPQAEKLVFLHAKLVVAYRMLDRLDDAERVVLEAIDIIAQRMGDSDVQMHEMRANLGMLRHQQGREREALRSLLNARDGYVASFGPEHINVGVVDYNLYDVYTAMRMEEEAYDVVDSAADILEKSLGPDHPNVGLAVEKRGVVAVRLGRLEQAEEDLSRAAEVFADDRHETASEAHRVLGVVQLRTRRPDAALANAVAAVERAGRGENDLYGALATALRGRALIELGRAAEAKSVLEAALPALEKADAGPRHIGRAWFDVARALTKLREDKARATQLLRDAEQVLAADHSGAADLAELRAYKP